MDADKCGVLAPDRVTVGSLHSYLRYKIHQAASCQRLPITLCFVVIWALAFTYANRTKDLYNLEQAITFDITENANFAFSGNMGHKGVQDVNSFADFWSWMRLGMAPLVIKDTWPVSEVGDVSIGTLPTAVKFTYLHKLRLIGGIRMRFPEYETTACPNEGLQNVLLPSSGAYSHCKEPAFGSQFEQVLRDYKSNPTADGDPTYWVTIAAPLNETDAELAKLERNQAITAMTSRAEVMFLCYSASENMLVKVTVNFLFGTTGHIWKRVVAEANFVGPVQFEAWFFAILFYIFMGLMLVMEIAQVVGVLQRARYRGLLKSFWEYFGWWAMVDWSTVIVGFTVIGLQQSIHGKFSGMQDILARVPSIESEVAACTQSSGMSTGCFSGVSDIVNIVEDTDGVVVLFRDICGFYPYLIMLRVLKAFHAQPRLAIVTRTLFYAADDLFHFGVVLVTIFSAYATAGHIFFGRIMPEYATLPRSFVVTYRALLGDIDFDKMWDVGTEYAVFYYITLTMLLTLIMLNMLVAILMDVYSTVKEKSGRSLALHAQAVHLFHENRAVRRGEHIPLYSVLRTLRDAHKDVTEVITPDDLAALVPKLSKRQATEIVQDVYDWWWRQSDDDAPTKIDEIAASVRRIERQVGSSVNDRNTTPDMLEKLAHTDPERLAAVTDHQVLYSAHHTIYKALQAQLQKERVAPLYTQTSI